MLKTQIDRLQIQEKLIKGKVVSFRRLIPKGDENKPLMMPDTVAVDSIWSDWMGSIPVEIEAPQPPMSAGATVAATGALLCVASGFVVIVILPIIKPHLKAYFDLLNLSLPWLVCFFVFISYGQRNDGSGTSGQTRPARNALGLTAILLALGLSPILLIASARGVGVFVVGADCFILVCVSVAMALAGLAIMRWSRVDTLNMKPDIIVYVAGLAGLYGYGAALTANELFDRSAAETTPVVIESKYVETGRRGGSFFKLAPWGPEAMERSYRPSLNTFNHLQVSDTICASLYQGAIGMRWYQLHDRCSEGAEGFMKLWSDGGNPK